MAETIDTASMMKKNSLYMRINELDEELYSVIKEKKIEIKDINDIERIERFFNPLLKKIVKLIDEDKTLMKPLKMLVKSRVVLDFHGNLAEKYNLDLIEVINKLGRYNKEITEQAMKDLKGIM